MGEVIFETLDIDKPWNGDNTPMGCYVYMIEIQDDNGLYHTYRGLVSLIK